MHQTDALSERLFETLINGDRLLSRAVVSSALDAGITNEDLITDVLWPTYEQITTLYRNDQLSRLAHHMGTRLLRTLLDQIASGITMQERLGRSVVAFCGPNDADELAGEMAVDIMEGAGYDVTFAGPGVASDEILAFVQQQQPDCLVLFSSAPTDLPEIRSLIDQMREIGACAQTQVVVGGGVFNRAEGLAEEIGADLWAGDPLTLVERMIKDPDRRADSDQRTVGSLKPAPRAKKGRTRRAA